MTAPHDEDRLLEHRYDDIQEYDNPMPAWWVTLFWVTIVFSILYYLVPGLGLGDGRMAEYNHDMAAYRAAHPTNAGASDPAALLALTTQAREVSEGKRIFGERCAVCHAADGGGNIGPNLTDAAWIYGASIDSIYRTIGDGVVAKGMPPWNKMLSAAEMNEVVAYVWTLRGTTPAKPKAPQGVVAPQ